MKFHLLFAASLTAAATLAPLLPAQDQIIPKPAELKTGEGASLVLTPGTTIIYKGKNRDIAGRTKQFRSLLAGGTGLEIGLSSKKTPGPGDIEIFSDASLKDKGEEAYSMRLDKQGVLHIGANTGKGVFYAAQSLFQMLPTEFFDPGTRKASVTWKAADKPFAMVDYPRFSWRALMIDEARHFFGEKTIKQIIDQMAQLKMNVLHWHLTNDGGWRIEIKKYPKLTSIGSKRKDSEIGTWNSGRFAGKPHEGFYTQDQIRDIVRYAAERNITIVPEIEMPGHASAASVAYPYLSLKPLKEVPATFVTNTAFDPTSEKTYQFLSDVLDEVIALFPSKVIHIGGDEVRYNKQWQGEPKIQALMKARGIDSLSGVQMYFTNRMSDIVAKKGRRMMGWNEILGHDVNGDGGGKAASGKLDPNAVIQFWKGGADLAKNAIRQGHDVVNSQHNFTYLDYSYASISLGKAYDFEPIFAGLEPEYHNKVIGLGCQTWTEWISTIEKLHYQTFPRACAFAEVGWTPKEAKDFKDFKMRLGHYGKIMDVQGINYAKDVVTQVSKADFFNTPRAGSWSPDSLKKAADHEWDVTSIVKNPGVYTVTLLYDRGKNGVKINSVALCENGRAISRDNHKGFSGVKKENLQYKLSLPNVRSGARYTIKADLQSDGGTDSHGDVYVDAP